MTYCKMEPNIYCSTDLLLIKKENPNPNLKSAHSLTHFLGEGRVVLKTK